MIMILKSKTQITTLRKVSLLRFGLLSVFLFLLSLLFLSPPKTFGLPLKPEEAFPFQVRALKRNLVEVRFNISPGYYLYADKFKFTVEPDPIKAEIFEIPKGQMKEDPYFGKKEIFRGELNIKILLAPLSQTTDFITLGITYQGCADAGLCYPPRTQTVRLRLPSSGQTPPPMTGEGGGPSSFSRLFGGGNYFWVILSYFGFGLLLSLTPCVFPLIPVISGIIISQGEKLDKRRAFFLSLIYVLGMALTYSVAGVAAGYSGRLVSAALQNPWVLGAFALVFVLLAFSMFGFYDIQMPGFIQRRFTLVCNRLNAGTCLGVFLMGLFSAIIIGPCVTAPLAGALLYIGQTHNVWMGGSALFSLSLGMGIPLLIIGTSAGVLLPKAGAWMNAVKVFFGVLLLAVALWMVSPVLPMTIQMLLWGSFLIICSVFLYVFDPLPQNSHPLARLGKGLGVILLLLGAALLGGVLMGGGNLYQPLSRLRGGGQISSPGKPQTTQVSNLSFSKVTNLNQLEGYLREYRGRKIMLFISADWCVSCKELEDFTFVDPQVREKLKGLKLIMGDVTETNPETGALLKRFEVFGPPAILFFDADGKEIPGTRVIGYQSAEEFLKNPSWSSDNK
jgi:thioredoxin:protein disulfide reductase